MLWSKRPKRAPSPGSASSDEPAKIQQQNEKTEESVKQQNPETRTQAVLEEVKQETETVEEERQREDASMEYPKAWRLAVIMIALCLAVRACLTWQSNETQKLIISGLLHGS